jgi:UDP-2,4-diacetamido-2,4,6-trideoxy-beta-L-altropyranose hydrolase
MVIEAPASLAPHILAADLAITAGGTTCYELAAAGVPMLAIGIEPHQLPMIDVLARRGACCPLGMGFGIDVDRARRELHRFANDVDARNRMHAAQRNIFAGPGAMLAVQHIKSAWAGRT